MNHRFLGKCRRGFAHSPASKWGLPITLSSDLNVTYIIAFLWRQPCRTPCCLQKKKKKTSNLPRLEGACCHTAVTLPLWCKCLLVSGSLAWFAHISIHNWKWNNIKCHIFQLFNLKCNQIVSSTIWVNNSRIQGFQKERKKKYDYVC